MNVYLVHHADAVAPTVDAQRPLSTHGFQQAEHLAARAKEAGVKPVEIWHSGKLRSRQTAEFFWRACNPFASFTMVRGLRPEDPPAWIRDALLDASTDVMLVGHMPHLPVLRQLLTGAAGFPLHGLVWVVRGEGRTFDERLVLDDQFS